MGDYMMTDQQGTPTSFTWRGESYTPAELLETMNTMADALTEARAQRLSALEELAAMRAGRGAAAEEHAELLARLSRAHAELLEVRAQRDEAMHLTAVQSRRADEAEEDATTLRAAFTSTERQLRDVLEARSGDLAKDERQRADDQRAIAYAYGEANAWRSAFERLASRLEVRHG